MNEPIKPTADEIKPTADEIKTLQENWLPYGRLSWRERQILAQLAAEGEVQRLAMNGTWDVVWTSRKIYCGIPYRIRSTYQPEPEGDPALEYVKVYEEDGILKFHREGRCVRAVSVANSFVDFAGFAGEDKKVFSASCYDASAILALHHNPGCDLKIQYVCFRRKD